MNSLNRDMQTKTKGREEKIEQIIIVNPLNIWGKLAIKIIRLGGWLYDKTGNDWRLK